MIAQQVQQAVDVGYNKMDGTLNLGPLNELLAAGWTVNTVASSGGGDILVILDCAKPPELPLP